MSTKVAATEAISVYLGVPGGTPAFHSLIVHMDHRTPVQLEDRFVNPAVAPDYMASDFSRETPNAYLSRLAPIESV